MARPSSLLAGLAAVALTASAARAVNQLGGNLGFSNSNPEILAVLGAPGNAGLATFAIDATAQPPAPYATAHLAGSAINPVLTPWSMDVDSSAAGTTHLVVGSALLGTGFVHDEYYFLPRSSPPVLDEPAPDAALDLVECAGLIRVRFVDASGSPVILQGDRITADSSAGGVSPLAFIKAGTTGKDVVVRGDGSTWTVRVEMTYGTDPFVDRMTQLASGSVAVACDEIADLPVVVTTPGSASLGSMIGRLDVLGEDEVVSVGSVANTRSHVEATGPWRNLRADAIPGPPSEGAWRLDNLVASTVVTPNVPYAVLAETAFGSGHATSTFTTPELSLSVGEGETVDAGDAFVIDPVVVTGNVLLAGPPPDPRWGSPLQELWRAGDRDFDSNGIPDDFARFFDSTCVTARGRFGIAPGASVSALGASSSADLDGAYDAGHGTFSGAYRAVLGNLWGQPGYYAADELNVKLVDTTTPVDPPSYVDERVDVLDPGPQWELPGGGSASRDRAYCFSKITLAVGAPGGANLYSPNATGTGSFSGTNFLGDAAAYDATLQWARGVPNASSRAAPSGRTTFALPAGTWTIEPTVNVPQSGGLVSVVPLPAFTLDVGCRQVLEASSDAQVVLDTSVEPCTPPGDVSVSGRAHADAGVASLQWSVNGGAATVLCMSCGVDAPFSFTAATGSGDSMIRVDAVDAAGHAAAAELLTRSATEPSALDLRPSSAPVRVALDATGLRVSWEPAAADAFAIHVGTIASLHSGAYDHARVGACDRAGSSASIALPATDAYVLVTSSCGLATGSYGRNSFGVERPPSPNGCP